VLHQVLALGVQIILPDETQAYLAFAQTLALKRAAAYASFYLVFAEALKAEFWTADRRLAPTTSPPVVGSLISTRPPAPAGIPEKVKSKGMQHGKPGRQSKATHLPGSGEEKLLKSPAQRDKKDAQDDAVQQVSYQAHPLVGTNL
jgi:hypothetical protein